MIGAESVLPETSAQPSAMSSMSSSFHSAVTASIAIRLVKTYFKSYWALKRLETYFDCKLR